MVHVTETPEFLAWCLVHPCPLRQTEQLSQPLATERALKSLRAVSIARREGRIWDGVCIDQSTALGCATTPRGFPQAEVLNVHGGEAQVNAYCSDCLANTEKDRPQGQNWTGCFGWLALANEWQDLPQRWEECLLQETELRDAIHQHCPITTPMWYGTWSVGVLDPSLAELVRNVLDRLDLQPLQSQSCMEDDLRILDPCRLFKALELCVEHGFSLAVEMIPKGRIEDRTWFWPPHCGQCKTAREMGAKSCGVCGCLAHPLPAKKRKTRGTRPFIPLSQFLGPHGAKAFLDNIGASQLSEKPGD
jgi:hypothetical protein